MASASITIRMDSDLKERAEEFFHDIGLNMTTAFTMFVKQALRKNRIPFEVDGDPFYSEANQKRLMESIAEAEAGHLTPHELIKKRRTDPVRRSGQTGAAQG